MKKNFAKYVTTLLMTCSLVTTSCIAFAMDKRITSSGHRIKQTSYGGIHAWGWVTAGDYHYLNVKLYTSDGQERESGRKWGTGCVETLSDGVPYDKSVNYYTRLFYGFD